MDVLRKIRIEILQRCGIRGTSTPARNFAVLDSAKFVVLYPKITFHDLGRSRTPEPGGIASHHFSALPLAAFLLENGCLTSQRFDPDSRRTCHKGSFLYPFVRLHSL